MKANVQYNDFVGTAAADRSDYLDKHMGQLTEIIVNEFEIPIMTDSYYYIGVSVDGTDVEKVFTTFYFRNKKTQGVVKYCKPSVKMQSVLGLFKRFAFQVGEHLENIDETKVEEIENIEE